MTGARLVLAVCVVAVAGCSRIEEAPLRSAAAQPEGRPVAVAIARGTVEVPGGLFELQPPQDGTVAQIVVKEGDTVRPGQPLLRLDDGPQRRETALAQAELDVARARLQAQQARLPAAQQAQQRLDEGARRELVEAQRADEARQALQDLKSAVAVAQAEVALAQRRVEAAQAAAQRLVLTAPLAGEVLRVQVQPGARVAPAARPLLVLLPAGRLRVRAELNEAFAARVKPGMRALVVADGDLPAGAPGSGAPATVQRISAVFGASRLDPDAQPRAQLRVLDCYLDFDNPPAALRAGQAVRVEFHD